MVLTTNMNLNSTELKNNLCISTNSALMLNAACQAIIETYIQPSSSEWYSQIVSELSDAQALVKEWRTQGYLYFDQDIIAEITACGEAFINSQDVILNYFNVLQNQWSADIKNSLTEAFKTLVSPVQAMSNSINNYEVSLQQWGDKVQKVYDKLAQTINDIQAQESDLLAKIAAINASTEQLKNQIEADRQAIIKAQDKEKEGETETILGIILAPFTGGVSLILSCIGVASISEAEGQIATMQATINAYQNHIESLQQELGDDQKKITSLQMISLSASIVLGDIQSINTSLDPLKTIWDVYESALNGIIDKIDKADKLDDIIVCKAWFTAACNEWGEIVHHSASLQNINK